VVTAEEEEEGSEEAHAEEGEDEEHGANFYENFAEDTKYRTMLRGSGSVPVTERADAQ